MGENRNDSNVFILSELKNGKEGAFDFIFRKYYKALCAQANLYVKDLDKAQSLVQESFIKLWDKRSNADSIDNLSSYLSFMVRNQCIDYLRKLKAENKLQQNLYFQTEENSSEEFVLSQEFEERLVMALAILPERCREAFEYSRFEHLSYKEIAEKMDISTKAVEALMGRSLKILRQELKDYLVAIAILYNINLF